MGIDRKKLAVAGMVLMLGAAAVGAAAPAAGGAPPPPGADDPDPLFQQPYVDIDEWRDAPVRHRYVHGGFKGSDLKFSFYFPEKARYQGRFFQYVTPVPDSETSSQAQTGAESPTAFSIASGAYFVETNGGGASATAGPGLRPDPTIGAYRANAAAAAYSRVLAQRMYGGARPFGYIFGGSGGAFRTIGSIENTRVWDGAVPFVMGSPMAIPNGFAVRMHAMRVLWPKFPGIVDAMDAGGSGDPYAGLDPDETAALREATRFGFPIESWFGWRTMGVHAFTAVYPGMLAADPGYFDDFWTKPGYAGHDEPERLARDRLRFGTTVKAPLSLEQAEARGLTSLRIPGTARGTADLAWRAQVSDGSSRPVAFDLGGTPPAVHFMGGDLFILSGAAKGKRLGVQAINGSIAILGVVDPTTLAQIRPGDEVRLDNSNFLAAEFYHRHQVPGPEYPAYDQYRGADGKPIHPQRPMLLGPKFAAAASGSVPNGQFAGKMIVVESLWDREAYPWQADWYRQRVKAHLGGATDDRFRLWMTDRALHGGVEDPTRVVSYIPVLQQALRDLSAWVEKGTPPPATTSYRTDEGRVIVPVNARERLGVQPTVTLLANGANRVVVRAGQPVRFTAVAEAPPGAGRIVAAEWDWGNGSFEEKAALSGAPAARTTVSVTHGFAKPGTYFPVLRVFSGRDGQAGSFGQAQNLARVRVVVR